MSDKAETTLLRVVDLEATGFPPEAEPIEAGWTNVLVHPMGSIVISPVTEAYHIALSGKYPIGTEAMATHHIMTEDLDGAPPLDRVFNLMMSPLVDVFVAHNAAFEKQFIKTDKPWICTMKCAYQAFPDSPRHTNQVLRYHLKIDLDRQRANPPHAAGPDTYVTAHILEKLLLSGMTIDQMIDISSKPSVLPKVMFGKHKGMAWSSVPMSYLQWLVNQTEMDEDVRYTARHYIRKAYGHPV